MRLLDSCYFCLTPYHIITAVSLAKQFNESADLYIVNAFSGAYEIAERIRKEKIFSEVRLVKYYLSPFKNHLLSWTWITLSYVRNKKIAKNILIEDTRYNNFFVAGNVMTSRCSYFYLKRSDSSLKKINFEDGIGSYENDRFIEPSKKDAFIQRIIVGKNVLQPVYCQLLYWPDLYYWINGHPDRRIDQINGDFKSNEMISLFNRIFNFSENDKITERIILLDCLKDQTFTQQGETQLREIYEKIFQVYGTSEIIIKRHPRDTTNKEENIKYYSDNQIPFECICMNMDSDEKVLISTQSTAVITPKILLGQEPCVLLLYKLVEFQKQMTDTWDAIFNCCRQSYSDPKRFMIPKTVEELDDCLKFIKEC